MHRRFRGGRAGHLELDLSPCAAANFREAAAALWQIVNDLALVEDRPEI